MTVTITLGSWIAPATITVIAAAFVAATAYSERNDSGLMAGLGTALVTFCGLLVTLTAWAAWAATIFLK